MTRAQVPRAARRLVPDGDARRNAMLAVVVVAAHAATLWAMQRTFAQPQPAPDIVPAEVIATLVAPPAPEPAPPAPLAPLAPQLQPHQPQPRPQPSKPVVKKTIAPKAAADPAPAPAPLTPQAVRNDEPQQAAPTAPSVPPAAAPPPLPAPAAPAAAPAMELPSSDAAYLNNPPPSYPATSRRLGEQGKVFLRVYINAQGEPEQIDIKQSSGYDRLDEAARQTVRRWKFAPGKRNGVPEAMWHIVPIDFVLK
jgi:protein TonB